MQLPASIQDRLTDTPWVNGRVPNGYWDDSENRRNYLRWLGQTCGFHEPDDWYGLRKHHFESNCGAGLLRNFYRSSVQAAVHELLPDKTWYAWRFGSTPRGYWKVRENRQSYMNWLAGQLRITQPDDWYRVTGADFFANDGGGLLNNEFRGSVQAVLADYLPDYPWKAWKFGSVPQSYWRSTNNRREYLTWLGNELGFRTAEDWNRLRREDFHRHGGSGLFVGYYQGSARRAIAELFADSASA